jgi:hypothetical protein
MLYTQSPDENTPPYNTFLQLLATCTEFSQLCIEKEEEPIELFSNCMFQACMFQALGQTTCPKDDYREAFPNAEVLARLELLALSVCMGDDKLIKLLKARLVNRQHNAVAEFVSKIAVLVHPSKSMALLEARASRSSVQSMDDSFDDGFDDQDVFDGQDSIDQFARTVRDCFKAAAINALPAGVDDLHDEISSPQSFRAAGAVQQLSSWFLGFPSAYHQATTDNNGWWGPKLAYLDPSILALKNSDVCIDTLATC